MLYRILILSMFLTLAAILFSCMTPKEKFLKQGATLMTQQEIYDAFRGNTITSVDWSSYYREDGVRIVDVRNRDTYRSKWYFDPLGKFCQGRISGKTECNMKVYRLADSYKVFSNNVVYQFNIRQGNPLKLK